MSNMKTNRSILKRGDVWYYSPNDKKSGHLQQGARPVVIVSNNTANRFSPVILAIPCTSKIKKNYPTHSMFILDGIPCVAMAEQIFPIDRRDLVRYMDTLDEFVMQSVEVSINRALALGRK